MKKRTLAPALIATLVVIPAAACGGSSSTKAGSTTQVTTATTTPVTTQTTRATSTGATVTAPLTAPVTTPKSELTFKAHLTAANHSPVVNENWPITVTVTDLSGKPIAATVTLGVVTPGFGTYEVDNGKVYHFVGRHHENITWPGEAVGFALKLEAVVTAHGQTTALFWPLTVRR